MRKELLKLYMKKSCFFPFISKVKITDYTQFDSLVEIYSIAGTKNRRGDIGLVKRGTRQKEFEDVAFKLKPGELSKVFQTGDSSWTILLVTEHTPVKYRSYDEVKASIEMNLKRERQRKVADEFLNKIKQEADIKIFLPEEKPEEPVEKPEPSPEIEKKEE